MTGLSALRLPILLSAVLVFVASSVIHMLLPWHKGDYPALPDEARFRGAVGPLAIPPGDYFVPRANSPKDMKTAEFMTKMTEGPVVVMTVLPNAQFSMGRNLAMWFVYCIVVGTVAAFAAGRALPPGAPYMRVFEIVAACAFAGYALALWQMTIWYSRAMGTTIRSTIDGAIYALLSAGIFGWLWPR
jgi:hypothetical protein